MVELVNLISENGILLVLAGLYIYNSTVAGRRLENMMREVQLNSSSIAKSYEQIVQIVEEMRKTQLENSTVTMRILECVKK